MELTLRLASITMGWPVTSLDPREPTTGHRAMFADTGPLRSYLQPVVAWGMVENDGAANAVPMVWDESDQCLTPATAFQNFVGLLEPSETGDALEEELTAVLATIQPREPDPK